MCARPSGAVVQLWLERRPVTPEVASSNLVGPANPITFLLIPATSMGQPLQSPTRVRWLVFGLACASSWMLYLHRYTWNFIGPELERTHGLSKAELGTLFSFFIPPYGLLQIPSGIVSDLVGPHLFLGLIMILWSLALPLHAAAGSFFSLAAVRVLFGTFQAGCYPNLAKVTQVWFPRSRRTIIQGWVATFFGRGGGAMSPILFGTLLIGYCGFSWQSALVLLGGGGVLLGVLFLQLFRNSPKLDPRTNQAERDLIREGSPKPEPGGSRVLPWRRVARNRSMRYFVLGQIMSAAADTIYVSFMGDFFLNAKGIEMIQAGILVSLPLWGGAVGGMVGGYCNDWAIQWSGSRRWGRSLIGFSGKFLACLLMLLTIRQESAVAAGISLFAVKFFTDWSQPTTWGTCTDLGGRYSATLFGIINTSGQRGRRPRSPALRSDPGLQHGPAMGGRRMGPNHQLQSPVRRRRRHVSGQRALLVLRRLHRNHRHRAPSGAEDDATTVEGEIGGRVGDQSSAQIPNFS